MGLLLLPYSALDAPLVRRSSHSAVELVHDRLLCGTGRLTSHRQGVELF